jgi:hypothetical protein
MRRSTSSAGRVLVTLLFSAIIAHATCGVLSAQTISTFTSTPATVSAGQPVTLTWATTGATYVSLSPNIGRVGASGSRTVTPARTTTYRLTAMYWWRSVSRYLTVTVANSGGTPPTITSFVASPTSVTAGQSSMLSWSTAGATNVLLNGSAATASGTKTVTPAQTTTYTLSATNTAGTTTAQATVRVGAAGDVTPPTVSSGQPSGTLPAGTTTATLSVLTNENATCGYSPVANTALAAMTRFTNTGGTTHTAPLTGLVAGNYLYYVKCSDATSNVTPSDFGVFFAIASTPPPPPPTGASCAALPAPTGTTVVVSTASQLANAVSSAASGTTILMADGTYTGVQVMINKPNITIRSQSGNRDAVVIDGNYTVGEIFAVYASNFTIANLTVKRAKYHAVHLGGGGHYATLYNLHVVDCGEQGIKENPNGSSYNDYGTLACSLVELTPTGRTFVEQNTAAETGYPCYTGGIDAHAAQGWTVRDNTIQNFWCSTGLAEHGIHFWSSSRDTVVTNNTLINNARSIGFGLGQSANITRTYPDNPLNGLPATSVGHIGGVIRNNFIYANISQYDTGIGLEQAYNASVYHNTILGVAGRLGLDVRFGNSNPIVRNNLMSPGISQRDGGAVSASAGNVTASASMFVAPTQGNLHLLSTATLAINTGVPLNGLVPTDIDGDPRDSAPDAGADEYIRPVAGLFGPAPARTPALFAPARRHDK